MPTCILYISSHCTPYGSGELSPIGDSLQSKILSDEVCLGNFQSNTCTLFLMIFNQRSSPAVAFWIAIKPCSRLPIMQTRLCNILQLFTAVKMKFFK